MRILKLTLGDIRFQAKYGFYSLYLVFSVLYIFLLMLFPLEWRLKAGTVMIYSDPAALGLFFMGAIILLEKSQRVLSALAVSPVKVFDYILAKVLSLFLISVADSLLLALVAGFQNLLTVIISTALTSVIFSMLGLTVGAKISSLNHYIIGTIPLEILLFVLPLIYLFRPIEWLRWYPLCGAIALLEGSSTMPVYDTCSLIALAGLLFIIAHSATSKMWSTLGGAKI